MYRWIVALSLLCFASSSKLPETNQDRVVNGEYASILEHPYICSFQLYGAHFCGANILNEYQLITAGHCFDDFNETHIPHMSMRCGTTSRIRGGVRGQVESFKIHEQYAPRTFMNDIALVQMATPIVFTNMMQPVTLPDTLPAEGTSCRVCGWGRIDENIEEKPKLLQTTNVNLLYKETCASDQYLVGNSVMDTMICGVGNNTDACKGDSGGPMVNNDNDRNELVGVVSWGRGCKREGFPGVYANVAELKPWIMRTSQMMRQ